LGLSVRPQVQSRLTPTRSPPGWAETSMQGPITTPGDDKVAGRTPPPPQFPPLQPQALAKRMAVDVVIGGAEHWKSRGGEM